MNRKKILLIAAATSLAAFVVYLPTLGNEFVWDDGQYLIGNPHLRSVDGVFFKWAFTSFYASNWHPLTWLSHALDYAAWGMHPAGHHLTNIVIHSLNTFLVVLLCIRMMELGKELSPTRERFSLLHESGIMMAAGVTGLLFGLHPVHVESVAWVSERKDLLCGLFFLLSVLAYCRHVSLPDVGRVDGAGLTPVITNKSYVLSLLFFILALMSKPMAVSLPVVLLVLDWHPFRRIVSVRTFYAAVREKLPFIVLSVISSVLTIQAQKGAIELGASVPFPARVLVAARSYVHYIINMAAPVGLTPYYPYPRENETLFFSPGFGIPVILVIGITAVLLVQRGTWRSGTAAWSYFLLTLVPVIGLIQVGGQSMADRYTYLPSIGPFFLVGMGASWAWSRAAILKPHERTVKIVFLAAVGIVAAVLSAASIHQMSLWKNNISLWSRVIEKNPEHNPFAYHNRGTAFMEAGQRDRAMEDLTAAISQDPAYFRAYGSRGELFKEMGEHDRALADYTAALELRPRYAATYTARGMLLESMGRAGQAYDDFSRAIALDPGQYDAYLHRGSLLRQQGLTDRAREDYTAAIHLQPNDAAAYFHRGMTAKDTGQYDSAVEDYTHAIHIAPSAAEIYNNRGVVYKHLGKFDQAIADYTTAVTLDPTFSLAYCNRGIVYGMLGRTGNAIEDYTNAITFQPGLIKAYLERGDLYKVQGRKDAARDDYHKACSLGSMEGCRAMGAVL